MVLCARNTPANPALSPSGAGKSTLIVRYADDTFNDALQSTVGVDFKLKTITLLWQRVRLQLWDTNGQERFRSITRAYYRGAQGIALVYDVTDERSFRNIAHWVADIREHDTEDDVVVIICANKIDREVERVISTQVGRELATKCGCDYFETSAKTGYGVEQAFTSVAERVLCGAPRSSRRGWLRARQRLLWAQAATAVGLPATVVARLGQDLLLGPPSADIETNMLDAVLLRHDQQRFVKPQKRRKKKLQNADQNLVSLRDHRPPDEAGMCW